MAFLFNYIMKKEIWKEIPGYEGMYEVSDLGRVKSLKYNKERILKPYVDSQGYYGISLSFNNKAKTKKVHQLVAITFLNHTPDGTTKIVVDHIDNNPLNNRLDNLQVISQRENTSKDKKGGSSNFIGVSWTKARRRWRAAIRINKKEIYLGDFKDEEEASNAYQSALTRKNNGLSAKADK